ncbi:MAG: Hsp20/alpha crystallin family protein [Deltaproteobacteria bacterium]|nr:MAG: Hsp20/alpha crystallin family protein [Deltaproteobacteria bacterium]
MQPIKIRFGNNIKTQTTEEKSFEGMFQSVNPLFCFSKRIWKPQMDILETRNEIIIQVEIAGVEKKDLVIEVSNKAVKISGSRKGCHPDPTATYRLAEIQFGQFERILYLPTIIDVERVSASFSNGFLELTMGKFFTKKIEGARNVSIDFI